MRYLELAQKHSDLRVDEVIEILVALSCLVERLVTVMRLQCQNVFLFGDLGVRGNGAILFCQLKALRHDDMVGCAVPMHLDSPRVFQVPLAHVFTMAQTETVYYNVSAWQQTPTKNK